MVRLLASSDFDRWLELWHGYQAFYRIQIPPAVTDKTWSRLLDPNQPMFGAVVDGQGGLVGLVHYVFHRSTWTEGDYCYLQDLFVAADIRGRGRGRQLIQHVYDAAKAAGAARVHWLTHETNQQAMVLYDKVAQRSGFVQYRHLLA